MARQSSKIVTMLGIDIGKTSFHLIGLDKRGAIVLRRKLTRLKLEPSFANLPPCLIGMEACVGAHHPSRRLKALGHKAKLMPAKYARPHAKGQKNDFRDAEAVTEAVQRPTMKLVATKTQDQLDLQAMHRVRSRLVRQGHQFLRAELGGILATRTDVLSPLKIHLIEDLALDWRRLDKRIDMMSAEIERVANEDAGCTRLRPYLMLGRLSRPLPWPLLTAVMPSRKDVTSLLGWRSCPKSFRQAIAPFLARSQSRATAIFECPCDRAGRQAGAHRLGCLSQRPQFRGHLPR